ncbi:hypothetical protein HYW76_01325 [Candidatus Pacearchaeota archaeon]|nr:hypothetical protein [Candidatus Pacearchaeota archaeon]
MGKKKKILKSIDSFEERIKEHEKKIEDYEQAGGKDYSLIEYWEKEIETFKKFKKDKEDKIN